ncbi:MAG: hypothetical protein AB7R40_03510 [Nitrospiraceae bacterium]
MNGPNGSIHVFLAGRNPMTKAAVHDSAVLLSKQVAVVFDGTMTTPQLDHAEGLAFDHEGFLYCVR